MDLEEIKKVVNSEIPDNLKEFQLLTILSKDEKLIPTLLGVLQEERKFKKELITDMNLELSRAHIFIDVLEPHMQVGTRVKKETALGENINKNWMLDNISAFYNKYKGRIVHCFNRFN